MSRVPQYELMSKRELYEVGLDLAKRFLVFNNIDLPVYLTYEEALQARYGHVRAVQFLRRVMNGPAQGTGTGLQVDEYVFVNLDRCAWPVWKPKLRSWSWPGYKTDRTPVGVVAHEVGHYVSNLMGKEQDGEAWRALITKHKKTVSGYEPVPSEAMAETMRLFILNPQLLRMALPERYQFVQGLGLCSPLEKKNWREVIGNKSYFAAAERWIQS